MKKYVQILTIAMTVVMVIVSCPAPNPHSYTFLDYEYSIDKSNVAVGDTVTIKANKNNDNQQECNQKNVIDEIKYVNICGIKTKIESKNNNSVSIKIPAKAYTSKIILDFGETTVKTNCVINVKYPTNLNLSSKQASVNDTIEIKSNKPFFNKAHFSKEKMEYMLKNGYPLVCMQKTTPFVNETKLVYDTIMYDGKYPIPFENYIISDCSLDTVKFKIPDWAISGSIYIRNENGYTKNMTFLHNPKENSIFSSKNGLPESDYQLIINKYPNYTKYFFKNENNKYSTYSSSTKKWIDDNQATIDFKDVGIFQKYFYDVYYDKDDSNAYYASEVLTITK